jgi:hypothetical protein
MPELKCISQWETMNREIKLDAPPTIVITYV